MKKLIYSIILVAISFILGWQSFNWYYNVDDLFECNKWKSEVIRVYEKQDSILFNTRFPNPKMEQELTKNSHILDSLYSIR